MLQLSDSDANHLCDVLARHAGAFLVNKDDPPAWAQPYFGIALDVAGALVSLATNGLTSARAFRQDAAQTVLNVILLPGAWAGSNKLLAVRHEVRHVRQWIGLAWDGKPSDKIFQAFPAEYVANKNGAAFLEGQAYAAQAELLVVCLGATADDMRGWLQWLRDVELPMYNLGPAQIDDAVAVVDAVVTGALRGAAPSADTAVVRDEMRRMGLLPSDGPSAPSAR
jgi:hypothetical protein